MTVVPTGSVSDRPAATEPGQIVPGRWRLSFWQADAAIHWWLASKTPADGRQPAATPTLDGDRRWWGAIPLSRLAEPMHRLRDAIPDLYAGESPQDAVRRALAGSLNCPEPERQLAAELADLLLPISLRLALAAPAAGPHTLVIATCPQLARIPWDLLRLGEGDLRVIERAQVRAGLHHAAIPHLRREPHADASLAIIDPTFGTTAAIYSGACPHSALWRRIGAPHTVEYGLHRRAGVTRAILADALSRRPGRLFYFGHLVSGPSREPTLAGLLLADGPLTAADLFREPAIWPMPARVALIGCQGDDAGKSEPLGLVTAALSTGAELVTSTRWVLPQDAWVGNSATTRLGIAVDHAHAHHDPVAALRLWQLTQLQTWRRYPLAAVSPLIWAAPVTYRSTGVSRPQPTSNAADPTAPPSDPVTETAVLQLPGLLQELQQINILAAQGHIGQALRRLTPLLAMADQIEQTEQVGHIHLIGASLFFQYLRLDLVARPARAALKALPWGSASRSFALGLAAASFLDQGLLAESEANILEALHTCPPLPESSREAFEDGRPLAVEDTVTGAVHAVLRLGHGDVLRRKAQAPAHAAARAELHGAADRTLREAALGFQACGLAAHAAYCRYLQGEVARVQGDRYAALRLVTDAADHLRDHPAVWVRPAVSRAELLCEQGAYGDCLSVALPAILIVEAARLQFADSPDRLRWAALGDQVWDVAFRAAAAVGDGRLVAELIERARASGSPLRTPVGHKPAPWSFAELTSSVDPASVALSAGPAIRMPWGIAFSAVTAPAAVDEADAVDVLAELNLP